MKWIFILGVLLIVAVSLGIIYNYDFNKIKEIVKLDKPQYQGPVPEGYNETHFRKTGETIKENG